MIAKIRSQVARRMRRHRGERLRQKQRQERLKWAAVIRQETRPDVVAWASRMLLGPRRSHRHRFRRTKVTAAVALALLTISGCQALNLEPLGREPVADSVYRYDLAPPVAPQAAPNEPGRTKLPDHDDGTIPFFALRKALGLP